MRPGLRRHIAPWLRITLVGAIALGALIRFPYLDTKVYSHDETLTSLRTSGYLEADFQNAVAAKTVTVAELQTFQHANPLHDAGSTVRALAIDDPQHPPLYYLLDRSWDAFFGGSILARRSLGALFGLLTIPALYWLCRELLPRGASFALVATALFAVSPFELEYAQQAREYTLWVLLTVVSSALFVRASRTGGRFTWLAYAASLAIGMYTHAFFALVIAAHAVTTLYLTITRQTVNWRAFLLSVLAAGFAYAPWVQTIIHNRQTVEATNTWFAAAVPAPVYLYKWLFNVGSVFFDAEFANMLFSIALLPLAVLVAWSLYVLSRTDDRRLGAFVLALFSATAIPLLVLDILLHQSRATAGRYLVPAYVAINLAVAYWLALRLSDGRARARVASALTCLLLFMGIVSWGVSARATSWYTASSDAPVLPIAREITKRPDALILTNDSDLALQLSNYLRPTDRFIITSSATTQFLHAQRANRYLIEPSAKLCASIARDPNVTVSLAYEPPFTDSPMLHMSFMSAPVLRAAFSSLRRRMIAIHGDLTGQFRLWVVDVAREHHVRTRCQ